MEEKEAARSRLQTLLEETNVQLSNMTKAHNASTLELNRLKEERESLLEELRKGQESMDKEKSELMEENKANEERMLDIIDELEEEKEKLEEELEQRKHALSELKEQLCEAQSTIDTLQSSLSLNFAEKNRDLQAMKVCDSIFVCNERLMGIGSCRVTGSSVKRSSKTCYETPSRF